MINVAVIGVGSIGRHHARIFSGIDGVRLVAVVDSDKDRLAEIAAKYNCSAVSNYRDIINKIDAVSIAVPTTLHHDIALDFLKNGRHVLVEKPITTTTEQADILIDEARQRGLILQVGHLERFNSGVAEISSMVIKPRFIESRRLSPFLGRGIDVDVTLDLMIHDIDIILSLVDSDIVDLRATGARVFTDRIDVANAWIEFENGCIAQTVSSRVAKNKERSLKVFQKDAFLNLDYQSQQISCYCRKDGKIDQEVRAPVIMEPLKAELISFIDCIGNGSRPLVSGKEGKEALEIALKISSIVHANGC